MFSKQTEYQINRFARIASWLESEELRQVAAVAAIEAERTFAPTRGASFATYQARAVQFALSHHVDKMRSPVSASNGALKHLRGLIATPLQGMGMDYEEAAQETTLPTAIPALEQDLDIEAAKLRLRAIISLMPAAAQVLLHEQKPALVARKLRMRVSLVYSQTRNLKRRLAQDDELRALVVG